MAKKLERPDGTQPEISFFDDDNNSNTKKKKVKEKSKGRDKQVMAGVFAVVVIGLGVFALVNQDKAKAVPDPETTTTNQVNSEDTADVTTKPNNYIVDGKRDSINQLQDYVVKISDWSQVGEATLSIDRINNNEENKASRYYYYNPYEEESYGYQITYKSSNDGDLTSFGWRSTADVTELYSVLNYKGGKYLNLSGTNTSIRRTIGTRVKKFDWITIDDINELKFNSTTAGIITSPTNLTKIQAVSVEKLFNDGTANFFLSDSSSDDINSDTVIEDSEDNVEIEEDADGIKFEEIMSRVEAIVSEKDDKTKDNNYVDLPIDENRVIKLEDLTVGDIYSVIPDYNTDKLDVTYNLELNKEMENILSIVNNYILSVYTEKQDNISSSSKEFSCKMDYNQLNAFLSGLQSTMTPINTDNKILEQALSDAQFTSSDSVAIYTCELSSESNYEVVTHLLKIPTKDGIIKLKYEVKLKDKSKVDLDLPEKALKYENISPDTWTIYRDYISIMSSVSYCEETYNKICGLIDENYEISMKELVEKINEDLEEN